MGAYKYADRSHDRSGTHLRDPQGQRRVLTKLYLEEFLYLEQLETQG